MLRLPSLAADWLEHALVPIPGVMGSNPAISGVISGELILAAMQSMRLWLYDTYY